MFLLERASNTGSISVPNQFGDAKVAVGGVARVAAHPPIRATLRNKGTTPRGSSVELPTLPRPQILATRITKANNCNYISIEL